MKKLICTTALIGFILGYFQPIYEAQPPVEAVKSVKVAPQALVKHKTVKYSTPVEKIALYADKYKVSRLTMTKIVACESGNNPNARGDGGHSYGLVQIHLPSHSNITKAEALNSDFALDFLAKSLSQGRGSMWTCYRKLSTV